MSEYFKELRTMVGREKILIPETRAIVLDRRGEILLMMRDESKQWCLPGGAMDLDETVRESLHRVLRQGCGLISRNETLVGIHSGPEHESHDTDGNEKALVTMLFVVTEFDEAPQGSGEYTHGFVAFEEASRLLDAASARQLRDFTERPDGALILR